MTHRAAPPGWWLDWNRTCVCVDRFLVTLSFHFLVPLAGPGSTNQCLQNKLTSWWLEVQANDTVMALGVSDFHNPCWWDDSATVHLFKTRCVYSIETPDGMLPAHLGLISHIHLGKSPQKMSGREIPFKKNQKKPGRWYCQLNRFVSGLDWGDTDHIADELT